MGSSNPLLQLLSSNPLLQLLTSNLPLLQLLSSNPLLQLLSSNPPLLQLLHTLMIILIDGTSSLGLLWQKGSRNPLHVPVPDTFFASIFSPDWNLVPSDPHNHVLDFPIKEVFS